MLTLILIFLFFQLYVNLNISSFASFWLALISTLVALEAAGLKFRRLSPALFLFPPRGKMTASAGRQGPPTEIDLRSTKWSELLVKRRYEGVFWILFFFTAAGINLVARQGEDLPRSTRAIGLFLSFLFWWGVARLFQRFSIVRKILPLNEEEEEIDLDAPDPHEGGIKEDSEDPRKYLR